MKREWYEEVKCDYNNEEGFWCVDAWKPNKDEGEVIAVIHDKTGDVFYIDPMARVSRLAQEVIKEKVKEIDKMIWLDTEYIEKADKSIQTVIVGDDRVMYVYFYNGYYSIIEGAYNLHKFLNGDLSCRKDCFDNEENVERYLKLLER